MLRVHSADLHDHVAQEIGECLETGNQRLRPEQPVGPDLIKLLNNATPKFFISLGPASLELFL